MRRNLDEGIVIVALISSLSLLQENLRSGSSGSDDGEAHHRSPSSGIVLYYASEGWWSGVASELGVGFLER